MTKVVSSGTGAAVYSTVADFPRGQPGSWPDASAILVRGRHGVDAPSPADTNITAAWHDHRENKTITSRLTISAVNVTVRNCVVMLTPRCCIYSDADPHYGRAPRASRRRTSTTTASSAMAFLPLTTSLMSRIRHSVHQRSLDRPRLPISTISVNAGPDPHFGCVCTVFGSQQLIVSSTTTR